MTDHIFTQPPKIKLPLPYNATLTRDGKVIGLAAVDANKRILRCSVVTSAWDGTPRFDAWVRYWIPRCDVIMDGGLAYKFLKAGKLKEAA